MKKILLASVLVSLSSAAFADTKFDGAYAGIHTGYVDGKDEGKEYKSGELDGYSQKTTPDSSLFGAFAGYNKVLENNVLLGLEADYEYRGGSDTSYQAFEGVPDTRYQIKTKLEDAGSIRARVGYVFNQGMTLGYFTAGYATAKVKRTVTDLTIPDSESHSNWHDGWTVGLGAEHFVSDKITLKAEYRYSDYGTETMSTAQVYAGPYEEKQKYQDEQSLRLGAAYHF